MGALCDRNLWIGAGGKEREQWEEMDRFFKKSHRNSDMPLCSGKPLPPMRTTVLTCVCSGCHTIHLTLGWGEVSNASLQVVLFLL